MESAQTSPASPATMAWSAHRCTMNADKDLCSPDGFTVVLVMIEMLTNALTAVAMPRAAPAQCAAMPAVSVPISALLQPQPSVHGTTRTSNPPDTIGNARPAAAVPAIAPRAVTAQPAAFAHAQVRPFPVGVTRCTFCVPICAGVSYTASRMAQNSTSMADAASVASGDSTGLATASGSSQKDQIRDIHIVVSRCALFGVCKEPRDIEPMQRRLFIWRGTMLHTGFAVRNVPLRRPCLKMRVLLSALVAAVAAKAVHAVPVTADNCDPLVSCSTSTLPLVRFTGLKVVFTQCAYDARARASSPCRTLPCASSPIPTTFGW